MGSFTLFVALVAMAAVLLSGPAIAHGHHHKKSPPPAPNAPAAAPEGKDHRAPVTTPAPAPAPVFVHDGGHYAPAPAPDSAAAGLSWVMAAGFAAIVGGVASAVLLV